MRHLSVPYYEGLAIKDIFANIANKDNFRWYMPVIRELNRLPKQWIINVAFTVIGEPF